MPGVNIYKKLQNDPGFIYLLADHAEEFRKQISIDLMCDPFYSYILGEFPSLEEIPDDEYLAIFTNLDTVIIIENLFQGFLTPQRIHIEHSMFNKDLIEYMISRGYVDAKIGSFTGEHDKGLFLEI